MDDLPPVYCITKSLLQGLRHVHACAYRAESGRAEAKHIVQKHQQDEEDFQRVHVRRSHIFQDGLPSINVES